jgi:hypothetical protein
MKQQRAYRIGMLAWLTYACSPILAMPFWLFGKIAHIPTATRVANILLDLWIIGMIAFWIASLVFGRMLNRR